MKNQYVMSYCNISLQNMEVCSRGVITKSHLIGSCHVVWSQNRTLLVPVKRHTTYRKNTSGFTLRGPLFD